MSHLLSLPGKTTRPESCPKHSPKDHTCLMFLKNGVIFYKYGKKLFSSLSDRRLNHLNWQLIFQRTQRFDTTLNPLKNTNGPKGFLAMMKRRSRI